jgi:hypothetical protein
MTMREQIATAVTKALGDRRAEMTEGLFNAIVDEVEKTFTPVEHPADH